jgi:hypothetical protein
MTPTLPKPSLYEQDMVLWCADTIAKLREGNFANLDIEHLVEEIEGLANRDKKEVESRLDVLLAHLLKRLYVNCPDNDCGWENTIREQRKQLRRLFKQSPSLKNHAAEVFLEAWQDALEDVRANYPNVEFPDQWQFSREVDLLLSKAFWEQGMY